MWDCVKKATEMGIPFEDAVIMASRTPAELLGVKKGRIEKGYDADLLVIDDNMNIEKVIIGGQEM
jgi:N-acetylglucosamine-6-phosphate deacetylase